MKTTLPLIALLAAGQAHAAYGSNLADRFSVGLTYADVSHDVIDYDGFTLDARIKVVETVALRLSLSDASTGNQRYVDGISTVNYGLDARRYSLGGELVVPFTSSHLAFSLDFAGSTLDGYATDGLTSLSGDLIDNTQVVFGARYVLELPSGFAVSLGVTHYINDFSWTPAFEGLLPLKDNSTTAPSLAVAWSPVPSFTLQLAYSTEDTLLGVPDADGTVSLAARVNF